MKKNYRVKKYREFRNIIENKQFVRSENFIVYFQKNESDFERYGLMVTKKNCGIAVRRNKIKRQVRMMIDEATDYTKSLDVVVYVTRKYDVENFEKNKNELLAIISSIRS